MDRRAFLAAASGAATGLVATQALGAGTTSEHAHHAAPASLRYADLASVYSVCAAASAECIAHCQRILATGDKSMAECLKTALDCSAVCDAIAKLARFDSDFAPKLAAQAVPVMDACAKACKPHVEHHAICKACFDACNAAIKASTT